VLFEGLREAMELVDVVVEIGRLLLVSRGFEMDGGSVCFEEDSAVGIKASLIEGYECVGEGGEKRRVKPPGLYEAKKSVGTW
jgi:hypothetical protein